MRTVKIAISLIALSIASMAYASDMPPCKKKDTICQRLEMLQKQVEVLTTNLDEVRKAAKIAADQASAANKRRVVALVDFRNGAHREGDSEMTAGCQKDTPAGNHNCEYRANKICQIVLGSPRAGHLVRGDDSQNIQHILCYLDP